MITSHIRERIIIALSTFLVFGFFVRTFSLPVHAQDEQGSNGASVRDIFPVPPQDNPGFLGQDHSYSVTFRGNGEAVVSLKVTLTNKGEAPLTDIYLRVPRVSPQEFFVYQVLREPSCMRYSTDNSCIQYQEPDYYGYYWTKTRYQKAQTEFGGDTLKVTLPQAIAPNKSGSYFVYFRAVGYAKKGVFGAYKFTFESLKVQDDIRNLTVGISTDSDMVLRGAKGEVQYRFQDAASTLKAVGGAAPSESGAVDTFYNQIGYGSLIKSASNLAPLESYTVSSSFADTRLRLYSKEILIGAGVLLGILLTILIAVRSFIKKIGGKGKNDSVSNFNTKNLLTALAVSFTSALVITGYTVFVLFAATLLTRNIGYDLQAGVNIFIVVITLVVYILFLFAPGIYLGVKKGIGWGLFTIIFTGVWMFVFLGIALVVYLLTRSSQTYPGPIMPLGGSGIETKQQY